MTTLSPAHSTTPARRTPQRAHLPRPAAKHDADADLGVLARLAALPAMPMPDLQKLWRDLYGDTAPRTNRKFLESRLAYRIQELAYGGLKPETRRRLDAMADAFDNDNVDAKRSSAPEQNLLVGTRLIREWQGVEHAVTVLADGFEWEGRPYASLSSVARAITGTRWNGPLFFGMRTTRGRA